MIITLRTDKPEAEIGLYDDAHQLAHETWEAHRQLSVTIHTKMEALLKSQKSDWKDIDGVVCFKGPGSFTGLRIGHTVANSLAANLNIPVVANNGSQWKERGIKKLISGENEKVVLPDYGREARITLPKK